MPDVSVTESACDLNFGTITVKGIYLIGHRKNGSSYSRTHVDRVASDDFTFNATRCSSHDIININEIATLHTIFKNLDSSTRSSKIRKNRQNSSIRILERLSWSIDVLVTQCKRRNSKDLAKHKNHLFLNVLGQTIE